MTTLNRVTVATTTSTSIANIEAAAARLASMQNQLSSGQAITTPSDNPSGTVQAMQLRGQLSRNTQYGSNASDALSWLGAQDSAYSQIVSVLQNARTLVVQGLNSGTADASSNAALAQQLSGLRTTLISLANTAYGGRPVFGGTTASPTAYDSSGSYLGDGGAVTRAIGPGSTVTVGANGPDVFGDDSSGTSVFTLLQNLSAALTSNPPALSGSALGQLDSALSRVSTAQSVEGATYQQVQRAQTTQTSLGTSLQTQLTGIEDVDVADMAVKVAAANTSYQAALQTTASIGQLSLLNFLH